MLSKDEVKQIAALARVGVNDQDVEKYQKDLSEVLDYFKSLEELDTESVPTIGHITGRNNVLRSDQDEPFALSGREAIKMNAPETKDGYIKVKSVL